MSRATDLRYGRRGGGWVPDTVVKETRRPWTFQSRPCPNQGCAGQVRIPIPRPTQPWVEICDGMFTHTFDVTPLTADGSSLDTPKETS